MARRRKRPQTRHGYYEFDLGVLRSAEHRTMPSPHLHSQVEVDFLASGRELLLFGESRVKMPAGRLVVFWAITPHQVVASEPETLGYAVHLPLPAVQQWRLPDAFVARLMRGELLMEAENARAARDADAFATWYADDQSRAPERRAAMQLEIEARLVRLASAPLITLAGGTPARRGKPSPMTARAGDRLQQMIRHISENYTLPLTATDVAESAGLHPKYAMTLFRQTTGLTLHAYLTRHRLVHAQRMLATTDAKVLDVAAQSGFPSVGRFYETFVRHTGKTPRAYRQDAHRQA